MKNFFIKCILLCNFYSILFASETKPTSLSEITMDSKQIESISSDLPAKSLGVDSFENVWFIGSHFLWKWVPTRQTLQKIKLATELPLRQLFVQDDHIFVSDDESLFYIESNPVKIVSYKSLDENSQSLALDFNAEHNFWIKSDGIYELSLEENSLRKIHAHNIRFMEEAKYLYIPSQETLWMLRNKTLSCLNYSNFKQSNASTEKIAEKIQDIQKVGKNIFALSRYAVFRYSESGKLIQTVPVSSTRRIVLSSLKKDSHVYVFQDRLLEVHRPKEEKTYHFYLDLERVHKATTMFFQSAYLGLILDGKPRVYEFSTKAWDS